MLEKYSDYHLQWALAALREARPRRDALLDTYRRLEAAGGLATTEAQELRTLERNVTVARCRTRCTAWRSSRPM